MGFPGRSPESRTGLFVVISFVLCFHPPASAFYEGEAGNIRYDLRASLQAGGSFNKNPDNELLQTGATDRTGGAIGRLLIDVEIGDRFGFEFNGFQFYTAATGLEPAPQDFIPVEAQRSSALEWSQRNSSRADARLGVDRLNLRFSADRLDVRVGRQPVNLATVFYFTPNDFFAPFAPQTFFRDFKPGVDAARGEVRLGNLTQLSLIGVLGYEPDPSKASGWSSDPEMDRSSFLARILSSQSGFEWGLLGGRIQDRSRIGGSLQGEVAGWLGIRAEGHYAFAGPDAEEAFTTAAVDLEHRFPNSLTLRLEQFTNSGGFDSVDELNRLLLGGTAAGFFIGSHYTAFGSGYEFSPLLNAEGLLIYNWIDHSALVSVNAVYSLSDETDLSPGLSIPIGKGPETTGAESEFGLLPYSVYLELRHFF